MPSLERENYKEEHPWKLYTKIKISNTWTLFWTISIDSNTPNISAVISQIHSPNTEFKHIHLSRALHFRFPLVRYARVACFQIHALIQYIQKMTQNVLCTKLLRFFLYPHVCSDICPFRTLRNAHSIIPQDILSRRILVRSDLIDSASVALGASWVTNITIRILAHHSRRYERLKASK